MKYMKLMKKILYSDMYHVEANGIAAIALGFLCIYGLVNLIRNVIVLFQ